MAFKQNMVTSSLHCLSYVYIIIITNNYIKQASTGALMVYSCSRQGQYLSTADYTTKVISHIERRAVHSGSCLNVATRLSS